MAKAKKKKTVTKAKKSNGKIKKAKSTGGRDPAAIKLLKDDHRAVEELFEEFEGAKRASDKRSIAKEICLELTIHTLIEEEIFYPAIKDAVDEEIYGEAHVEHDGAKMLIAEIMAADPKDDFYDARVKVLSEMIKHHVKEEEEPGGMFAQAKKGKGIDFDALGEEMATRKEDLKRIMQRNGIPAPEMRTMHGAEVRLGEPVA
jgi:hemerythrin superfamily protein